MTVIFYGKDESESTNATNAWVTKLTATGPLRAVDHKIFISCEYGGSATNKLCAVRVLLDGGVEGEESHVPPAVSAYRTYAPFGMFLPPVEGEVHTLSLQFRAETLPNTAKIRRARMLVEQH